MGESESATTLTHEQDIEKRFLHNQNAGPSTDTRTSDTADPFNNEEGAEIKYKTMEWWQVTIPVALKLKLIYFQARRIL